MTKYVAKDGNEIIKAINSNDPKFIGAYLFHVKSCKECNNLFAILTDTIVQHIGPELRKLHGGG